MNVIFKLAVFCMLLALSGCETATVKPPAVIVPIVGPATAGQIAAFEKQIEILTVQLQTERDLAARASAAVYGVLNANPLNAPSLARDAVEAQAAEAASALPKPTTEQKLIKERQNAAIMAGELIRVKAEMGQTMTENEGLRAEATASAAREKEGKRLLAQATIAAEKERASAAGALRKQFADMTRLIEAEQRKVEEARSEQRRSMLSKLGYVLLGLGTLFTLIGAFQAYATVQAGDLTPKGFLKPMVWGGSAAFAFTCYWTINQAWFIWVVIIGGGLGVIAIGLFLFSEWREAKIRLAGTVRSSEADEAEQTLNQMIGVIDGLPDIVSLKTLRDALSKKMSDPNKALVLELKAETKRATPSP